MSISELTLKSKDVLCGAATWIDAAAVVHMATARPKAA